MNSCMRQTGSMNPMRNNFTSGMNCSDMEQKTTNCTENKNNAMDDFPIGMAYVPWQQWRNVVDGRKGLAQATIFNELALNFNCANKCCGNSQTPNNLPCGRETQPQTERDCGCDRKW